MSIRPIIDQLQACYRNECYWFSAYYLICQQVMYGVDIVILCDFLLGYWMLNEEYIFDCVQHYYGDSHTISAIQTTELECIG